MSPVGINGVDEQGVGINGVQVKQALAAASVTLAAGVYDATTLSVIDADLAVGNIKSGQTIFGKAGIYTGPALADDILGSTVSAVLADQTGGYSGYTPITATTEVTLASKTQSYDASSLAVGVAAGNFRATDSNIKIRLVMDGVQVAEGAYVMNAGDKHVVMATRALSGSVACSIRAYNYGGSAYNCLQAGTVNGGEASGVIAVGSVKK